MKPKLKHSVTWYANGIVITACLYIKIHSLNIPFLLTSGGGGAISSRKEGEKRPELHESRQVHYADKVYVGSYDHTKHKLG